MAATDERRRCSWCVEQYSLSNLSGPPKSNLTRLVSTWGCLAGPSPAFPQGWSEWIIKRVRDEVIIIMDVIGIGVFAIIIRSWGQGYDEHATLHVENLGGCKRCNVGRRNWKLDRPQRSHHRKACFPVANFLIGNRQPAFLLAEG
jgi:hypothetical protein